MTRRMAPVDRRGVVPAVGLLAVAVALVVFAGCGVETLSFAPPPATSAAPSAPETTLPPDRSGVSLDRVNGSTTLPAVALGPGGASLNGSVLGPLGPVAGATVEVDRIVGSAQASRQVATAADGSWALPGILGGRYRVRAWQAPSLAMITPQIFFLAGNQTMGLTLPVSAFSGQSVASSVNPQSTDIGGTINLVVVVSNQSVSPNGFVSYRPAPGVGVTLAGGGILSVGSGPTVTDSSGDAAFSLVCMASGSTSVTGTTSTGISTTVPTVGCFVPFVPPPTTATTLPGGSTTTAPGSSTTTTPGGPPTSNPLGGIFP